MQEPFYGSCRKAFAEVTESQTPAALPALLLPYQVEAIELSHNNALSVFEKSRRTGLTYAFAPDAVTTAAASQGGMDVFYIAYNLDMTREFIGYCAEFTKAFDLAAKTNEFLFNDGSEQGIKAFRIDFPSGHSIVALSSKPRSLRGKQGVVIIDEAAFHEQLKELLKAAMALLMWGGRVIVISTHDGADNPFNELVEEIRSGKRKGNVQRLTLESALQQGLYKRICLRTGKIWSQQTQDIWEADLRSFYGDAAEEELDVIPARGSGTYLARATIEAAMSPLYPVLRLSCPNGFERGDLEWRASWVQEFLDTEIAPLLRKMDPSKYSYFGQDFARSSDLSAIAVGQYDELVNLNCHFILEMRNVPSREQEQVLEFIIDGMALFGAGKMDGRGNGFGLAEAMQDKYGAEAIELVMATPKTYLEMMPRLKARIEDRTISIPRSDGVIEDLRCIKLVKGIPSIVDRTKDKEDGAKGKRHGDTAIALMHLVAAADEDTGPVEFHRGVERATSEIGGNFVETSHGSVRKTYDDSYSL
jgi:phage FluMu gp28-like protein